MLRNVDHIFLPDREHIHHRLIDLGLSHRNAVLTLYGVAALLVGAAFALVLGKSVLVALVLVGVLMAMLAMFFVLLHLQGREAEAEPTAGPDRAGPPTETLAAPAAETAAPADGLQRHRV
jgi:hypothetical protein